MLYGGESRVLDCRKKDIKILKLLKRLRISWTMTLRLQLTSSVFTPSFLAIMIRNKFSSEILCQRQWRTRVSQSNKCLCLIALRQAGQFHASAMNHDDDIKYGETYTNQCIQCFGLINHLIIFYLFKNKINKLGGRKNRILKFCMYNDS